MKNNRKQKELPTLGKFSKVLERHMMTQNNYRKYHHIPMLRGEIKHQKRLLTITLKKYIGKTGEKKSFYKNTYKKLKFTR